MVAGYSLYLAGGDHHVLLGVGHDLDTAIDAARRGALRRCGMGHAEGGPRLGAQTGWIAVFSQAAIVLLGDGAIATAVRRQRMGRQTDRKSTRLNSSH